MTRFLSLATSRCRGSRRSRVSRRVLNYITAKLRAEGYLKGGHSKDPTLNGSGLFKVAMCMYYFGRCKGDSKMASDYAGVGETTVDRWVDEFCDGVVDVLKLI